MKRHQIGWIGLGNMGTPIVHNLLKAGYEVKLYNRTAEKAEKLLTAGAKVAASPQELARDSEVVFTMVSDDAAVKEVYESETGVLTGGKSGLICVDMSTVSPVTSRSLANSCEKKGIHFLDAPVSGSVKPAQEGSLIIMVGGPEDVYKKIREIFDVIGKLALYLGNSGSGSSAKLAINYLLGLNLQGLAETVLFAQKKGIKPEDMLTIINEGACGNGITKLKSSNILSGDFPAAFALKHLAKDLRLAKENGLDSPLSAPLVQSFQDAQAAGLGDLDVMAIIKYLSGK